MLTCADCKAIDCANVGIDTNACDNYDGEVGASAPAHPVDTCADCSRVDELEAEVDELRRVVDGFLAAIVKFAQGEW